MKRLALLALATCFAGAAATAVAGGELPQTRVTRPATVYAPAPAPVQAPPVRVITGNSIAKSKIGPPLGAMVPRMAPLPAPERRIGDGSGCNDLYGPTYYYPFKHNNYEGLDPTYYPFHNPRLWPNYKTPACYPTDAGTACDSIRPQPWDDYDNWTRGGRYGEKQ